MAEDWAMCNPDTGEVQYVMSINDNTQYTNGGNYNGLKTNPITFKYLVI